MMVSKPALGMLSVILTVVSILPYIWHILRGQVRPHVFSWIIWCLACAILALAQYIAGAGPGAWATSISSALSLVIVMLAFLHKSDWSITRSDWLAFLIALAILPVWFTTHNVLWAAVLATIIDSMAYYPTYRKSYYKPHQEMAFLYFVANLKHLASIAAMTRYSVTALVMPVSMLAINAGLIALLFWRRHKLARR